MHERSCVLLVSMSVLRTVSLALRYVSADSCRWGGVVVVAEGQFGRLGTRFF